MYFQARNRAQTLKPLKLGFRVRALGFRALGFRALGFRE